uniref:CAZy families GH2 protein n=1 Tax=uncultured Eggerthella sp. TaxID=293422 RepID=A0A060BWK1_9ACTN|nr:CAZy families GH2 protein [uncultured Eggerthella sp.]
MERPHWASLNGWWDYAVVDATGARDTPLDDEPVPDHWDGTIRVPFAIETAASGVHRKLTPDQVLHYHRRLASPRSGGADASP